MVNIREAVMPHDIPKYYHLKDANHMLWLTQCKGTPLSKLIAWEMFFKSEYIRFMGE